MDPLLTALTAWGPPGIIIGALLLAVRRLHAENSELHKQRVADAKELMRMADEVKSRMDDHAKSIAVFISESRITGEIIAGNTRSVEAMRELVERLEKPRRS